MTKERLKSIQELKDTGDLKRPDGVFPSDFGHGTALLNLLSIAEDAKPGRKDQLVKEVVRKIKKKIAEGILPANSLNIIGYDDKEELEEWRE